MILIQSLDFSSILNKQKIKFEFDPHLQVVNKNLKSQTQD